MTNIRTITVNGHFEERQITKIEFVRQWSSHAKELYLLASEAVAATEIGEIVEKVEDMATREFERLYKVQNNG